MRVVVITGASSGIGRAAALQLAARGDAVVLAARAEEPLERVAVECAALGGSTLVVPTDVRSTESVESLFTAAVSEFGRVDGVIHSAAVLAYGRFEEVPREVWDACIDTTLLGSARVARAALELFDTQEDQADLVFIGSVVGKLAVPWMSSYATPKWGLHGLVRTLQIETRARPGIGISVVSPGGVDTPIYRRAATYVHRHGSPPPPVASPQKVAAAAVRCLTHPRRDRGVGVTNPLMVLGFRAFPAIYDAIVSPLMSRIALAPGVAPDGPGNVLEPTHTD